MVAIWVGIAVGVGINAIVIGNYFISQWLHRRKMLRLFNEHVSYREDCLKRAREIRKARLDEKRNGCI